MKIFLVGVFMAFSMPAIAGDATGTVERLYVHYHDASVLFRMEGGTTDYASCATTGRYVFDTTSQQGKNTYSVILAAKAAGQTVFVRGEGACTISATAETVRWVYIE